MRTRLLRCSPYLPASTSLAFHWFWGIFALLPPFSFPSYKNDSSSSACNPRPHTSKKRTARPHADACMLLCVFHSSSSSPSLIFVIAANPCYFLPTPFASALDDHHSQYAQQQQQHHPLMLQQPQYMQTLQSPPYYEHVPSAISPVQQFALHNTHSTAFPMHAMPPLHQIPLLQQQPQQQPIQPPLAPVVPMTSFLGHHGSKKNIVLSSSSLSCDVVCRADGRDLCEQLIRITDHDDVYTAFLSHTIRCPQSSNDDDDARDTGSSAGVPSCNGFVH